MTRYKRGSTVALALVAASLAFTAISVAGASAATFRYSSKGELKGAQTSIQATSGTKATSSTIFGNIAAEISKAEYNLHANGEVR